MPKLVLTVTILVIFLFKLVHSNGSPKSKKVDKDDFFKCPKIPDHVPMYVVIILAVTNFAMLIIILILVRLLYKQKYKHCTKTFYKNPPTVTEEYEYIRQDSGSSSNISLRAPIVKNESTLSIITETNTDQQKETVTEITNAPKPIDFRRKLPIEPIIKREQMDAILKDLLLKTKRAETISLAELNKIVNDGSTNKHEEKFRESKDKFASTPILDQYDVLPLPVPLKENECDEDSTMLYDIIPNRKSIPSGKIIVSDQGYILSLVDSDTTSYVNARTSHLKNKVDNMSDMNSHDEKELIVSDDELL